MKLKHEYAAGATSVSQAKAKNRKLQTAEQAVAILKQKVYTAKARPMLVGIVFMMSAVYLLHTLFVGTVALRLPFNPPTFMQTMTHYGVEGDDFTQGSALFVYVLTNISLNTYVKKFLALEGPRISMPQTPFG